MIPAIIPDHTRCVNCGECCGVFLLCESDIRKIVSYLKEHMEVLDIAETKKHKRLTCPFRDEKNKRCSIYPVRPVVCRLFGVAKGLECPNGNSHKIDGFPFIPDEQPIAMTNAINWRALVEKEANKQ
jgi:hypothetical protein